MTDENPTLNDRPPNFRNDEGRLFLVRCFACAPGRGTENWAASVASGVCAWCGWVEKRPLDPTLADLGAEAEHITDRPEGATP